MPFFALLAPCASTPSCDMHSLALGGQVAKKTGFWTPKKLAELTRLSKTMTTYELARHFDRDNGAIVDALSFHYQDKKLRLEIVRMKHYKITRYKPGYAKGTIGPMDDDDN